MAKKGSRFAQVLEWSFEGEPLVFPPLSMRCTVETTRSNSDSRELFIVFETAGVIGGALLERQPLVPKRPGAGQEVARKVRLSGDLHVHPCVAMGVSPSSRSHIGQTTVLYIICTYIERQTLTTLTLCTCLPNWRPEVR